MKYLKHKTLSVALLASLLLVGCASTDPYSPQSDKDFVYDEDYSFAMNVIDGSLGFHNGLRDARRPKDADTTPGVGSYAANGIIGAAFGGGLGGGLLSILGTDQGNAPLNTYYGIVYYPVEAKNKENIKTVFNNIEQELITAAIDIKKLTLVDQKIADNGERTISFSGHACDYKLKAWNFPKTNTCDYIRFTPHLLKYATISPRGEKGLYAVIGLTKFIASGYLSLELDAKYYFYSNASTDRTPFPFVANDKKIYPFVRPNQSKDADYLTIEQLINIDPWVKKHYYTAQ